MFINNERKIMKKLKKLISIIVVIVLVIYGIVSFIYEELDSLNGKNLDLNTENVDKNYTLVKYSEIQCCLYKNMTQKQIDKIRNSDRYPEEKLEGDMGTVLDGVGVCVVGGRITKYFVTEKVILVYERDSQYYYCIEKLDGKINFKSKKIKDIRKEEGLHKITWKNISGIKGV